MRVIYEDNGNPVHVRNTSAAQQAELANDAMEQVRSAARMQAARAAALGELAPFVRARRTDLAASYVAAEEGLIARDAARARAAMLAGDADEHHRLGRIVAARCFGIYRHPNGAAAAVTMVGGHGETASSWGWTW